MIIDRYERSQRGGWSRVGARITWEDSGRDPDPLWFEVPDEFANLLDASSDGFLAASAPLGLLLGERRIRVAGEVSPLLRAGLSLALSDFAEARGDRPPAIEALGGYAPVGSRADRRVAAYLSGGIDSLAMLRENRLVHERDHALAFGYGLLIFGLNTYDFAGRDPDPARWHAHERYAKRLRGLADGVGLTMLRLTTNVRSLYPDFETWAGVGSAGGLIGPALALGAGISDAWLASNGQLQLTTDLARQLQMQLENVPRIATEAVTTHIGQETMTRLDKVRLVAGWPDALKVVRPCLQLRLLANDQINCGECQKCLRTMLALVVVGHLDSATAFPYRDVTPAMVSQIDLRDGRVAGFAELVELLRGRGRMDLVRPLERVLSRAAGNRQSSESGRWRRVFGRIARGEW